MLYDIDVFGFVPGYISIKWRVMSEEDMVANKRLANRLYETKYQVWKRHNIDSLIRSYNDMYRNSDTFEIFCSEMYKRMEEDKKDRNSNVT